MKDNNIISKLYDLYSEDMYLNVSEAEQEINKKICEQEQLLLNTLTDEQKEIYNHLVILENQRNYISSQERFKYGFSLAIKLFIEGIKN